MDPPHLVGGSNLLQVFIEQPVNTQKRRKSGKKSKIKGFSPKARYELAKALSMVVWPIEPAHVSLTYHETWPDDPKEHLNSLRTWCQRQGWFGIWRLEFQERGAPHFHCLLCGFTELHEAKLKRYWSKLSGNKSEYASKVTYRESGRASWYLALHTSKGNQAPDIEVGRWWGWIDGPRVKEYMIREDIGYLTEKQLNRLARISRKLSGGRLKTRKGQSFSVFISTHNQARLVDYLNTV